MCLQKTRLILIFIYRFARYSLSWFYDHFTIVCCEMAIKWGLTKFLHVDGKVAIPNIVFFFG